MFSFHLSPERAVALTAALVGGWRLMAPRVMIKWRPPFPLPVLTISLLPRL